MMNTDYDPTTYQSILFVAPSFTRLLMIHVAGYAKECGEINPRTTRNENGSRKESIKESITISIPQLSRILPYRREAICFVLREHKIPIAQSCLEMRPSNLFLANNSKSKLHPLQREQVLKEANQLPSHLRISCLVRVLNHISISTSYW